jgi:glutathione synthase/RimK-type ligase-like ATP-grasp enzyme
MMTPIAFLACETTLPSAGERRGDAFEHDLMVSALAPAFAAAGLELRVIDWEAPLAAFAGVELALLGTAWDYQDKAEAFLAKLETLESQGLAVCNSSEIVRWNIAKSYLKDLAKRGAATIPTLWRETVTRKAAIEAMEVFETDRIVVKRQIGAGAQGQELLLRSSLPGPEWSFGHSAMLQPYLPTIVAEGELSFVFIDGALSHALRKRPAAGDYRIQSLYGGREETHEPSPEEAAAAYSILAALPFDAPLYARIDMLRGEDGGLLLMEAELIEPYLYPEQGPQLGERLAQAVAKRLQR